jgi:uncharacterized repeat protein (TIGR03803 family)
MSISKRLALVASVVGVVVPCAASAGTFTTLYTFTGGTDGGSPQELLYQGGSLYGSTAYEGSGIHGTLFQLDPGTGALSIIHSFSDSTGGANPSSLFYIGGTLYGTTLYGGDLSCDYAGTKGCGTIFAVNPSTGAETVLYTFTGSSDGVIPYGVINQNGTLYGATSANPLQGTVFSFDIASGNFTSLYTAATRPKDWGVGGFLAVGHNLYGTVNVRSRTQASALVRFKHGSESKLYKFQGSPDGSSPTALLDAGGTIYGVTSTGGASNYGTVFTFDPATKTETVLYSFTAYSDGNQPVMLVDVGGILYGITDVGGNSHCDGVGCGTMFKLDPTTGTETVLHRFSNGADGAYPDTLIYQNGTLYGATFKGASGWGTVFQYKP